MTPLPDASFWHRLTHVFGWQPVKMVDYAYDYELELVGCRCAVCGVITPYAIPTTLRRQLPNLLDLTIQEKTR